MVINNKEVSTFLKSGGFNGESLEMLEADYISISDGVIHHGFLSV